MWLHPDRTPAGAALDSFSDHPEDSPGRPSRSREALERLRNPGLAKARAGYMTADEDASAAEAPGVAGRLSPPPDSASFTRDLKLMTCTARNLRKAAVRTVGMNGPG